MPSISGDLRFFGLDLGSAWQQLRQPWLRMHEWPAFRWLTPAPPVRLLRADGSEVCWRGTRHRLDAVNAASLRIVAIELPDDSVLRRVVHLPLMSAGDMHQALRLQALNLSPFVEDDLVWGWRGQPSGQGGVAAEIALASRKQVAVCLEAQASRWQEMPEVWVCPDAGEAIVLAGYGEGRRAQDAMRQRRIAYGLLLCVALLLAAMAITPTVQLGLRAQEAQSSYQSLALRARPVLEQRETLLQSTRKLSALQSELAARIDPLRVLELLTRALPDDTAVQSLKLQGPAVTISGQTADAAKLMQLLGEQPGLREVRAPTPATRQSATGKEVFTIAFVLDPKAFGIDPTAENMEAPSLRAAEMSPAVGGAPAAAVGKLGQSEKSAEAGKMEASLTPGRTGGASFEGGSPQPPASAAAGRAP